MRIVDAPAKNSRPQHTTCGLAINREWPTNKLRLKDMLVECPECKRWNVYQSSGRLTWRRVKWWEFKYWSRIIEIAFGKDKNV